MKLFLFNNKITYATTNQYDIIKGVRWGERMAKKKKKKGMFSKLTSKGIILTIQLIASAVFLGYIYVLQMLPTR